MRGELRKKPEYLQDTKGHVMHSNADRESDIGRIDCTRKDSEDSAEEIAKNEAHRDERERGEGGERILAARDMK